MYVKLFPSKALNEVNYLKQITEKFHEIIVLMPNKQVSLTQMPTSPMKEISEKKEEA